MEFFRRRTEIPKGSKVALLMDSPGGSAAFAYKLAKFFRRHCGGFVAVVPSFAKSAATLLALGADRIIIGEHAELGPLDAQETDVEEGQQRSVLNSVQTLERLNAFALKSLDEAMQLLLRRTGLKVKTIFPYAIRLAGNMVRPLMQNIDVVRYTETSRILKVAEEYAIRLLQPKYKKEDAGKIARQLVELYPEHGFVIDFDELKSLGLEVELPTGNLVGIMDNLRPFMDHLTAVGLIKEGGP
jgi:Serine dehydrogenase proteinase